MIMITSFIVGTIRTSGHRYVVDQLGDLSPFYSSLVSLDFFLLPDILDSMTTPTTLPRHQRNQQRGRLAQEDYHDRRNQKCRGWRRRQGSSLRTVLDLLQARGPALSLASKFSMSVPESSRFR